MDQPPHFALGLWTTYQQQQQQQILLKIGKQLITLLSHPQIAYKLIEAGEAEDILQNKIYI